MELWDPRVRTPVPSNRHQPEIKHLLFIAVAYVKQDPTLNATLLECSVPINSMCFAYALPGVMALKQAEKYWFDGTKRMSTISAIAMPHSPG